MNLKISSFLSINGRKLHKSHDIFSVFLFDSSHQYAGDLAMYYQRKVQEAVPRRDKNKMAVLNAVRNKLIKRVFAVVDRGENGVARRYEKTISLSLFNP